MLPRTLMIIGMVLTLTSGGLVAISASAGSETNAPSQQLRLVLKDGTTLEVAEASIQGKLIHARLPDGRLQAYLIEDVDLDQSGLTTSQASEVAPTPTPPPGFYLSSAKSRTDIDSVWTLTDADVEHVLPEAEADPEATGEEGGTQISAQSTTLLEFSGVGQRSTESGIQISGSVKNISSSSISGIVLGAIAFDANNAPTGRSRTSIDAALNAGMSSRFEIEVELTAPARSVRLTVESPLAPIAAPAPSQPSQPPRRPAADEPDEPDGSGEGEAPPVAGGEG